MGADFGGDGNVSERMTAIDLPGQYNSGFADYGRQSIDEMISRLRSYAQHCKDTADAILNASDGDFRIRTYVGHYVQKNTEILQEGRKS